MATDPSASRRVGPPAPVAVAAVRSLGGPAGTEFACPRRARVALTGHVDVSERHATVAVLLAIGALARHVPAAGTSLAGRSVPTTPAQLGELALVRGARLDAALHALTAAGLAEWGETGAGLSVALTEMACAPHPTLVAVPWEAVVARLATGAVGEGARRRPGGTPRTSALALFVELALLTEASMGTAMVAGTLAAGSLSGPRSSNSDAAVRTLSAPRLAPDFTALARELGYHRSRLTPAVHALHDLGLVHWDAEPGLRGTVQVAPWALGLEAVPSGNASADDPEAAANAVAQSSHASGISGATPTAPVSRAPIGAGSQCVLLGNTPIYVAPGTPLDFSARTADGRPALRFMVGGVEILLPLDGSSPQ